MDSLENSQIATNRIQSYRPDFSFNRAEQKQITERYLSLSVELAKLQTNELIQLLLDQIQQNEKSKQQLFVAQNKIQKLSEQIKQFQISLKKKRQIIGVLCETQTKNLNLIQKLEIKLKKPLDIDRQTHFEQKYRQLSRYVGEYINSINEAQDQFQRKYSLIKNQNMRLYLQVQQLNSSLIQIVKRNQILIQQFTRVQKTLNQFRQHQNELQNELNNLNEQNQNLKRQIQICHQNIKMSDRIQFRSDNQISSQLDFIREKINENENISRDIIVKYEQKQQSYDKLIHEKQNLSSQCNKLNQILQQYETKIKEIQLQNCTLKKKQKLYLQEIQVLQKDRCRLKQEVSQVHEQYASQNKQKQIIKGQLIKLAEQVKRMQGIYMTEIQQSQKIKEQLHNFWLKKEKKDTHCVLKEANTNINKSIQQSNAYSTTFDNSNFKNSSLKFRKNLQQNDDIY